MAGARGWSEVHSYPADQAESFDDGGYVVVADQDGDNRVHKHDSGTADDYDGTHPVVGVNYVSTYDQDDVLQTLEVGDELDVVTESAGFPVHAENQTYNLGETVYLSQSNDGRVNNSDSSSAALGKVVEYADHSGNDATDANIVIVSFSLAGR